MPDCWFRLPQTGTGVLGDSLRPDFYGHDIDGFSGNMSHPDGAPHWVVRVYGDETTLDALANEPQVVELSDVPVQALNSMFGQERDADGWKRGFRVR